MGEIDNEPGDERLLSLDEFEQKVRKPTTEDFKQHILPRLKKGIFGDGTTEDKSSPVLVVGGHSFVEISAG